MPKKSKSKSMKQIFNNNSPNVKFQYNVMKDLENNSKVKPKDVFDMGKKKCDGKCKPKKR